MVESKLFTDEVGTGIWYVPEKGREQPKTRSIDSFAWHKEDGPALVTTDGHYEYWVDNKRHRLDGPAVEYGSPHIEDDWFLWDNYVNPKEYKAWCKERGIDLDNLSPEDEIIIEMGWNK